MEQISKNNKGLYIKLSNGFVFLPDIIAVNKIVDIFSKKRNQNILQIRYRNENNFMNIKYDDIQELELDYMRLEGLFIDYNNLNGSPLQITTFNDNV